MPYDHTELASLNSPIATNNRCTRASGTKWYDFVQLYDSFQFAISDRVRVALRTEGITGWDSIALDIPEAPTTYHLFFPTSKAGPILNLEALNNYGTEILEFDLGTWDGKDVFSLHETTFIICTGRVRQVLEAIKATNTEIGPL